MLGVDSMQIQFIQQVLNNYNESLAVEFSSFKESKIYVYTSSNHGLCTWLTEEVDRDSFYRICVHKTSAMARWKHFCRSDRSGVHQVDQESLQIHTSFIRSKHFTQIAQ